MGCCESYSRKNASRSKAKLEKLKSENEEIIKQIHEIKDSYSLSKEEIEDISNYLKNSGDKSTAERIQKILVEKDYVEHRKKLQAYRFKLMYKERSLRAEIENEYAAHRRKLQAWQEKVLAKKDEINADISRQWDELQAREAAVERREENLLEDAIKRSADIIRKAEQQRSALLVNAQSTAAKLSRDIAAKEDTLTSLYKSIESEEEYYKREKEKSERLKSDFDDYLSKLDAKEQIVYQDIYNSIRQLFLHGDIDGYMFEEHVAEIMRQKGYRNVTVTQKVKDYGTDITAEKDGVSYVVQCKYYSEPVGLSAVQQAYAAKEYYKSNVAIVATNNIFTKAAQTLAKETRVILWDYQELGKTTENS